MFSKLITVFFFLLKSVKINAVYVLHRNVFSLLSLCGDHTKYKCRVSIPIVKYWSTTSLDPLKISQIFEKNTAFCRLTDVINRLKRYEKKIHGHIREVGYCY